MATETKTFTVEVKAGAEGKFRALISTFDVPDKYGDIVRRGAFKKSLDQWRATNGRIPVIFAHQDRDPLLHVGEVNPHNSQETATGLMVNGHLYVDEERGAKVFRQLQRGALREWSFGFLVPKGGARPLPTGGRELLDLELVELGPTVKGAGETETLEVRSQAADFRADSGRHAQSPALTDAQRLAPRRAQLRLAQLRVARWK